jgi:hypothetical protein
MRAERIAWIVGGVGLVLCVLGAVLDPDSFAFAWLAAATVWLRWPLGCLILLLVHALTGGRWGFSVRPWLVLGIGLFPLLLPAIIPILLLARHLYPWLRPGVSEELANGFYLNAPFATVRWFFYLLVWFGLGALVLLRLRRGGPSATLAAPGLILLGLTVNFASIDAIMSLDPHFNSSVFGMMSAAETGLFALSITIMATVLGDPVSPAEREDLARLLQGLLILWAYLDFMQLLIVWQSDLPHEAAWYLVRSTGLWGAVAAITALAHFLLPFLALLLPSLRRSVHGIVAIAGLLIVMGVLRDWWLMLPAAGRGVSWVDFAAVMAFGGISTGFMLRGPSPRWRVTHA